ncbi:uncharacterized protein LOC129742147 [Uranotaenia lowii]|uniref:uncharacterized protein LOC129742147 n=1 Tax=Uranotaenia lowii TaxID=190385 RepID=UPI00247902EE|nr:uncharacterized protein LOC129742147 [Uranotaenia lowii]
MAFFDLHDKVSVMPFVLRLMKLFGMRGSPKDFVRFVCLILWIFFVTLIPKTFFGYRPGIQYLIRGIAELIFQFNIAVKMFLIAARLKEFDKLRSILNKWYRRVISVDSSSEAASLLISTNKRCDFFSKGYFLYIEIAVMLYNILPPIRSTLMYLNRDRNSSEPLIFITHMEQEFYGLDIHSNIAHYWFFSTCAMSSYIVSTTSMTVQATLLYCACNHCFSLFKVVAIRLKSLPTQAPEAVQQELGDIVSMHVDALRCIELLEKIVNLSALVQSSFVTDAISNYLWYEADLKVRRSLLRMLQRAQKPVGFSAAGFYFINIERFGKMAQTSYSIYVVMKDSL